MIKTRELDYMIRFLDEKDLELGGDNSKRKTKQRSKFLLIKDDIQGKMRATRKLLKEVLDIKQKIQLGGSGGNPLEKSLQSPKKGKKGSSPKPQSLNRDRGLGGRLILKKQSLGKQLKELDHLLENDMEAEIRVLAEFKSRSKEEADQYEIFENAHRMFNE